MRIVTEIMPLQTYQKMRLAVQLQNGWYHGRPCWLDLDEEFQEVDAVSQITP